MALIYQLKKCLLNKLNGKSKRVEIVKPNKQKEKSVSFLFTLLILSFSTELIAAEFSGKVVSSVIIEGNKITSNKVIERELTFTIGDTIGVDEIDAHSTKSRQNLYNTSLFNFVTLTPTTTDSTVTWKIEVDERWYVWPFPILEYSDRNLSVFLKDARFNKLNIGTYVKVDNFRGMKEQLKVRLIYGYRNQIGLSYSTLYIDKAKKHGLSLWSYYATNNEIAFNSFENKPAYYKLAEGRVRSTIYFDISYTYRPKLYMWQSFSAGFINSHVSDSVVRLNPNYFGNGNNHLSLCHVRYEMAYDTRNFRLFPLSGYYFYFQLARIGILPSDNFSYWHIETSVRKYTRLFNRTYLALDLIGKANSKNSLPYSQSEALGYENYIRGYEYYTGHSSAFMQNKNALLFEVLPTKAFKLPFIPPGRFKKAHLAIFLSIFADTGYAIKNGSTPTANHMEGQFLTGTGAGINFLAYYDVIFRIEYSRNKFGEDGIFFHFGTPFLKN
jgi:outer membrane protein assembly factor BamA